ncbi:MAG: hypothetical protein Q8O99_07585 [bacterium]|nr:hypothetical protein [bacterium]
MFEKAVSQMKRKITMPTYGQLNELAETIEKYMNHPYRTPLEFRKYLFNYISGLPGNKGVKKHIS